MLALFLSVTMSNSANLLDPVAANSAPPSVDELTLVDIVRIVLQYKTFIGLTVLVITSATGAATFTRPNLYTATATLIPVEKSQSSSFSSLMSSMGGSLGIIAAQAGLGGGGASERFTVVLKSRTLAEKVINNQNLKPVLFASNWDEQTKEWTRPRLSFGGEPASEPSLQSAVDALWKVTEVSADKKTGVISVSVTTQNPQDAARVANTFTEELDRYLKDNTLSSVKRNRVFIETQLTQAKQEMSSYETALKNFQQKNQLVSLDSQTEAAVRTYSDLKSKMISAEIELKVLQSGSLGEDPRVVLKQQEIAELKRQLGKFEGEAFSNAPSLGLSYARLKRELLIREKVFELLTQQYEMAKIQEAQEDISFQVLDPAIAPEKKSGPRRLLTVAIALLASTMLGTAMAFLLEFIKKNKEVMARGLKTN